VGKGLTKKYVFALALDPKNPATVYAATEGSGVFRSTSSGLGWYAFSRGLPRLEIDALAIDSTGRGLYAATCGGGVFDYRFGG
jgi:hypothetical protein